MTTARVLGLVRSHCNVLGHGRQLFIVSVGRVVLLERVRGFIGRFLTDNRRALLPLRLIGLASRDLRLLRGGFGDLGLDGSRLSGRILHLSGRLVRHISVGLLN